MCHCTAASCQTQANQMGQNELSPRRVFSGLFLFVSKCGESAVWFHQSLSNEDDLLGNRCSISTNFIYQETLKILSVQGW